MKPLEKKLWFYLFIMALLSPLGILLPEKFNAGDAWGEWGPETLEKLIGFVPKELMRLSNLWQAPLPDYSLGGENASLVFQVLSYVVSGLLGMALVGLSVYFLLRLIAKNGK